MPTSRERDWLLEDSWMDEYRTAPEYKSDRYRSPAPPTRRGSDTGVTDAERGVPVHTGGGAAGGVVVRGSHTEAELRSKVDVDALLGEDSATLAALLAEYRARNAEKLRAHAVRSHL
eukprot:987893-Prorocentrum_minimum.AAC.1